MTRTASVPLCTRWSLAAINLCAAHSPRASRELPFFHVDEGEIREGHADQKRKVRGRSLSSRTSIRTLSPGVTRLQARFKFGNSLHGLLPQGSCIACDYDFARVLDVRHTTVEGSYQLPQLTERTRSISLSSCFPVSH